ncbi:MAG: hypothetical protein JOZ18_07660 [Chloroflexi bacterium]|nr:hypothetical protein [Chloroflexota bacterium]
MSKKHQQRSGSASPVNPISSLASDPPSVQAAAEVRRLLGKNLPSRSLFEQYRPLPQWFLRPDEIGNIHGIKHEARVMVWQELLARLLIRDGKALDQEALRWAAATHDTQRMTDGSDFPHGERAAAWVEQTLRHRIPERSLATVVYLNTWHVPPDISAPYITPELAVFKDADGLDRVRIYDLDPKFLRWGYSKTLLQHLAQALLEGSEEKYYQEGYDLFDCVIAAAIELGIVIAE